MSNYAALESAARELLERRWSQIATESSSEGDTSVAVVTCPALWILRDLVDLAVQSSQQPVRELTSMVRRLLVEQAFVDENGDTIIEHDYQAHIDQQVEVVIEVLEQVREIARGHSQWADSPNMPEMFG